MTDQITTLMIPQNGIHHRFLSRKVRIPSQRKAVLHPKGGQKLRFVRSRDINFGMADYVFYVKRLQEEWKFD